MLEGWTFPALSELATFVSGGTPNKDTPEFWGGEIPWVTVSDMKSLRLSNVKYRLTASGSAQVRKVDKGTVLVLVRGMGLFKDLPLVLCEETVTFNQDIKALIPRDIVESVYLAYAIIARKSQVLRHVDTAGHGTGRLDTDLLKSTPIPLPPLPEQRRIAAILRTWDEAIEKLNALRAAAIKRRSWTRSNLLRGEVRLGNFSRPWETVALGEVVTEHGQNSVPGDEVFSVSVHKGLVNQIEHLGRSFSAANTDHYNRVLPGDIVYTKSPTGDFPLGIIKQSYTKAPVIVSPLYGVFTPESDALGLILDSLFESPVTVQNYLHPLVQKGAKNTIAITNTRFLDGKLILPRDLAEQEAIADYIRNDRAYVDSIDAEITALKRQKRGLMQKLLTGEWRVGVEKMEVAE